MIDSDTHRTVSQRVLGSGVAVRALAFSVDGRDIAVAACVWPRPRKSAKKKGDNAKKGGGW